MTALNIIVIVNYPSKSPPHLPPLSKVRCCRPKKFGRLPEGLPHLHRLALQHPFQNRTIPCFTPSPLPPLSKVRCCRPKKFGRLPKGLSLHHPFQNRTITLAFRSAIVCVCLYGFAFKLSHLAFRRARGLPLPLHRTFPFPQPLQKDNNPSPRITSQNRTIPCFTPSPLPLNERFVGFASMQSLWAFNFGHPCPPSKKGRWHG